MLEERRICAFIDILGFKNEILNSDDERRAKIISLIEEFTLEDSNQGTNSQSIGFGMVSRPTAEVTSFSDNIVISSNLEPVIEKWNVGGKIQKIENSPLKFIEHIFIKIISVYWRALHLGLLFRGGITIGKLYHKNRVVVGEALIKSYELEMKTSIPRIEVSDEVIYELRNLYKDSPINNFDNIIIKKDEKYIVNVFIYHYGVWQDYAFINNLTNLEPIDTPEIVENILINARENYEKYVSYSDEKYIKIANKWKWFMETLSEEFNKGHWKVLRDARENLSN